MKLNVKNNGGNTPAYLATKEGYIDCLIELYNTLGNLSKMNNKNEKPIDMLSRDCCIEMFGKLDIFR